MIPIPRPGGVGVLALAVATLAVSFPAVADPFPYGAAYRIALTGDSPVAALAFGPDGERAYAVAGDRLRSFEVATGAPAAGLKLPGGGVGLAASSDGGGSLYVAVDRPARLLIVNLHPLRIVSTLPLRGGMPSALLDEPGEHAVYVESRSGHSVARVDAASGRTIAVAHLQGDIAQMAGDDRGTLYVANDTRDAIDVIATDRMMPIGAIPTASCRAPTGLALDPVGRRLFVACSNGAALIIDTDMGFAFETLPIQKGTALRTVFGFHPEGPGGGWKGGAFIAGDAPALDAIRMNAFISYTAAGSLPLPGRATALAINPAVGQLWIAVTPWNYPTGGEGSADAMQQHAGVEILVLHASAGVTQ
ncbi:MAG TPA: hypothetical protein VHV80_01100 [Steroidobacteraceae bacterium]|nr:hypothetical protein [Steroidobacteraceae bacterium]